MSFRFAPEQKGKLHNKDNTTWCEKEDNNRKDDLRPNGPDATSLLSHRQFYGQHESQVYGCPSEVITMPGTNLAMLLTISAGGVFCCAGASRPNPNPPYL